MTSLLPANSHRFERALEEGLQTDPQVWKAAGRVGDIEIDIPDKAVPFLVWELGLEPVLPFITDARRVLLDGSKWQAIRGTPDAIEMSLGWIGEMAQVEEMPEAFNWNSYQIGLDTVPETAGLIANHIALSDLSAPIHMRLARIYAGYDRRTARINRSRVNGRDRVNDWSGVFYKTDWPKLSFGQSFEIIDDPMVAPQTSEDSTTNYTARNSRGFYVNRSNVNGTARLAFRHDVVGGIEIHEHQTDEQGFWVSWPLTPLPQEGSWRDIGNFHFADTGELAELSNEAVNGARWPIDNYPAQNTWRTIARAGAVYAIDNT